MIRQLRAAMLITCAAAIGLPAQSFDEWRTRSTRILPGGTPSPNSVVFVHGLLSSSETWLGILERMYLANDTSWRVFAPDLYPYAPFSQNADSLVRYMNNMKVGSSAVLVGHSMGGVVSRLASRQHPVAGVMSMGTPHRGAPLARALQPSWDNPLNLWNAAWEVMAMAGLGSIPVDSRAWEDDWIHESEVDRARDAMWTTIEDLAILGLVVFGEALAGFPAIEDLHPASAAVADLESGAYNERSVARISIAPSIGSGYLAGPFILALSGNRPRANALGDLMQENGSRSIGMGLNILTAANAVSPNYWDMIVAGESLMTLGLMEVSHWAFWNYEIVGGIPNDGVVPVSSMVMPRSTHQIFPAIGVVHTQQTEMLGDLVIETLRGVFRR